jgi:hypothetical protein
MPNNSQETILNAFNNAAGGQGGGANVSDLLGGLTPSSDSGLSDALTQATQVITQQTQATSANTDALAQETGRSTGGGGGATGVLSTVSQFLGGGLSVMPLVSLFTSIFGGGGSQQQASLVPYSMPQSLNLESTSNNQDVVWGENGLPRAVNAQPGGSSVSPSGGTNASPQITVQVQAIDSQSFLDHSSDIAQAVRQAMLNMNSINDVINEL